MKLLLNLSSVQLLVHLHTQVVRVVHYGPILIIITHEILHDYCPRYGHF